MVSFMVFSPVTGIRTLTENQSFLSSLSPMQYFSIPPLSYPNHDVTTNLHPLTVYSVLTAADTLQCCGDIKHRNITKESILCCWLEYYDRFRNQLMLRMCLFIGAYPYNHAMLFNFHCISCYTGEKNPQYFKCRYLVIVG